MAFNLRTWVAACVCEPMHAFTATFLHMQLGFQKYKKDKCSAIMAEVWNESHIVWELLQTLSFQLQKVLHGTFSKHTKILQEKPKIHQKIVNQKGVFHKTSLSHFYLIGTFSGPNLLSLRLLITFSLNCDKFDRGE